VKRLALLAMVLATRTLSAGPVSTQGNYIPMDYDPLPRMRLVTERDVSGDVRCLVWLG
jgi:hypothetical protein